MEKLYELHDAGELRPDRRRHAPTRHALDFLDAPRRLTRLLDNRIFRLLMVPTRPAFRVASVAAQAFLRTVARVVGREVIDDVDRVLPRVRGDGGRLPRPGRPGDGAARGARDRVRARHLAAARRGRGRRVLRRSPHGASRTRRSAHRQPRAPALRGRAARRLRARAAELRSRNGEVGREAAARLAARFANLADFEEVAERERRELAGLEDRIGERRGRVRTRARSRRVRLRRAPCRRPSSRRPVTPARVA